MSDVMSLQIHDKTLRTVKACVALTNYKKIEIKVGKNE